MSTLDKKAREVIIMQMKMLEEVSTESVMNLIRPHYRFDPKVTMEQALRRKAHSLMASIRDENGARSCYNCTDNLGESKYVNVDKTHDADALKGVEMQLKQKARGLAIARAKANRRHFELTGQMMMFGEDEGST